MLPLPPPTHDLAPIYALAAADRLVRTGVATAGEIDTADLDPAARAHWTAEQWARAEAAGVLAFAAPDPDGALRHIVLASQHSQHSGAPDAEQMPVWWDEDDEDWRTTFPPPAGFRGFEEQEPGHIDYVRELTDAERRLIGPSPDFLDDAALAALAAEREAFFAELAAARAAPAADRDDDV